MRAIFVAAFALVALVSGALSGYALSQRKSWVAVGGMLIASLALGLALMTSANAADQCGQFVRTVTREAHFVYGIDAPIPLLMGQIRQESSCRPGVTAWDNGRGLAQFMDGTSAQVARSFPELGAPDPYNPTWAIRALVRYDDWLGKRVKAATDCDMWGAVLSSYNGGLGYVQQSQRASAAAGTWFGVTERVPSRQSAGNFAYARSYPRKIIFQHQPLFIGTGRIVCNGVKP